MDVNVRKLEKGDIEQIIPLRIALQIYDNDGDLGIEEKELQYKTREFLEDNLNKDLYMFGTFVDNELVSICGCIIFKYFPQSDDLSCKVGYITSVFTKEEHREKGYQRRGFEECLNFIRNLGIIRFKLSTKNPKAMKMYSSMGFNDDKNAKEMKIISNY